MKAKLNLYTYSFPFTKPFKTSSKTFNSREGIVLEIQDTNRTALGEAAPLPGFSRESLNDVLSQLEIHADEIERTFNGSFSLRDLQAFHRKNDIYPSLQFGLDTLAVDFLSQQAGTSPQNFLFDNPPDKIKINGVISVEDAEQIYENARHLVEQGFQTIKIKVGINFKKELVVLEKIQDSFPKLKLRLDANRAWSLEEACNNLSKLEDLNIEYLEEPLNDPSLKKLKKLSSEASVPIALDESMLEMQNPESAMPYTSAIILKPMVFGGLSKLFATNRLAKHHNNKVIYTTSLESGIGRTMTATLAAGLSDRLSAHGLATGSLLKMDVWHDGTYINNGSFLLPDRTELGKRYHSHHKYLDKIQ